ncbi:MAG: mannonate dehydratase [Armatimonadetes bacterium]|nr:mannonate dehydratase [Armatimonadota bacterium]
MINLNDLPMRIALGQFGELTDEQVAFLKQCGCEDVLLHFPPIPGEKKWEFRDLVLLRARAEDVGLRLICVENVPMRFYDKIMLGLPGREEQLDNMCETVANMGRAGIPILGYHFMPNAVWRTSRTTPVRGGALATSFDYELVKNAPLSAGRVYTEEEMWENYDWYLERILPVCEEYNVRLALHPDDPPVASLGGIARPFRNFENFKRAMEVHNSPMHGLDFCHGCWSEMRGGEGVLEAIQYFGERGRLFYMHLRDVVGTAEKFTEVFVNDGNVDPLQVLLALKQVGFNGFIIDDHVPQMVNDSPWGHRARAWTTGYLMGLLDAVNQMGTLAS